MNFLVPYLVRWDSLNRSRYYQIFQILAAKGHNIHIVQPPIMKSNDTGFIEGTEQTLPNVFLHSMKINSLFWNLRVPFNKILKKGWYCIKVNIALKELICKYDIDAVIFYNMILYPITRQEEALSVYDLGDDHIELLRHELGPFTNNIILRLAERMLKETLKNSDLVFSVSCHLREKYHPKSIVLPNGVSIENVQPGCGKELRRQCSKPVIGFAGSLEYFINFAHIFEAASRLRDYTFVIAGGGRQFEWLQEEKKRGGLNNLILTGGLSYREILQYIDSFDICLNLFKKSPLTDGACPIKLFEYMAFKKPIISSRIQEVRRIDKDFIYWADSVEELVSAIETILSSPDDVRERTEKEYRILSKNYTWPQIVDKFTSIVARSLDQKNVNR